MSKLDIFLPSRISRTDNPRVTRIHSENDLRLCTAASVMKLIFLIATVFPVLWSFAGAQTTVIGYSSVTSVFLPFWIGKETGLYKKEGLDVQLVYIPSSTTMAQAMFAREVAISTANSSSVVSSGLQGGDLVLMGAVINTTAFYIIARPEIASVRDLRGKRVGVTRLGSSSDFAVREYLQKNKLQPGRDVTVIQSGGMPELAAALSSGAISAAPLSSPMSYVAEQRGNRVLANLAIAMTPNTRTRRLLLVVDAPSLLHRNHHARSHTGLRDRQGRPIWALHGMLRQILESIDSFAPDAVVFGLDDRSGSMRRDLYPDYKAGRAEKDPELSTSSTAQAPCSTRWGWPP